MPSRDRIMFSMLGPGAFLVMFLAGLVLAHDLGLGCGALLAVATLLGVSGAAWVARLERRTSVPDGADDRPSRTAIPPAPARDGSPAVFTHALSTRR